MINAARVRGKVREEILKLLYVHFFQFFHSQLFFSSRFFSFIHPPPTPSTEKNKSSLIKNGNAN